MHWRGSTAAAVVAPLQVPRNVYFSDGDDSAAPAAATSATARGFSCSFNRDSQRIKLQRPQRCLSSSSSKAQLQPSATCDLRLWVSLQPSATCGLRMNSSLQRLATGGFGSRKRSATCGLRPSRDCSCNPRSLAQSASAAIIRICAAREDFSAVLGSAARRLQHHLQRQQQHLRRSMSITFSVSSSNKLSSSALAPIQFQQRPAVPALFSSDSDSSAAFITASATSCERRVASGEGARRAAMGE